MKKEYRPQNLSTRRDFLLGTVQWTKDRQEESFRQLPKIAGLLKVMEDSDAEPCFLIETFNHLDITLSNITLLQVGIKSEAIVPRGLKFQISPNIDNVRRAPTTCPNAKMIIDRICYKFLSLCI
jgi:hypothetical protein